MEAESEAELIGAFERIRRNGRSTPLAKILARAKEKRKRVGAGVWTPAVASAFGDLLRGLQDEAAVPGNHRK